MAEILSALLGVSQLIAVILLTSVLPPQVKEYMQHTDGRLKKVSLVLIGGNVSLIILLGSSLMRVFVQDNAMLLPTFDMAISVLHSVIAVTLGILAKILYSPIITKPIEDLDNNHKDDE